MTLNLEQPGLGHVGGDGAFGQGQSWGQSGLGGGGGGGHHGFLARFSSVRALASPKHRHRRSWGWMNWTSYSVGSGHPLARPYLYWLLQFQARSLSRTCSSSTISVAIISTCLRANGYSPRSSSRVPFYTCSRSQVLVL
jgi:hypothetical protein